MSFLGGGRRLDAARLTAILVACTAICAVVSALAPLVGRAYAGGPLEILPLHAIWSSDLDGLVFAVRLRRVVAALLCGSALAGAGCAFQAVLRNPLAEPYTLGVSSGAALAAVIAIRLGVPDIAGIGGVSAAAVAGALVAVLVVWQIGRVGSTLPPASLVLAGVTVSMFASAASLVVQYSASFVDVSRIVRWMMGGLEWTPYETLARTGPPIGLGLAVLLWLGRDLNGLAAGPEAAASIGVDVGRTQTVAFGAASLLVGASIAIAGPVGFVGLIVPHALRALIGPDHRGLLPASILIGGATVVVCDAVARIVNEMPVGVVTALLGGPFFLVLLVRGKRKADLWRDG
ncbi:MAG TPA: iron ABC transporter permease [Kofleriaceae bacterium]|nr:iron ABC transporter permease [Kofleriaceae bacterium]